MTTGPLNFNSLKVTDMHKQTGFSDGQVIAVLIAVAVACIAMLFKFSLDESRRWQKFAAAHECKISQRMDGDTLTTTTVSANGNVGVGIVTTPSKTAWLCNDGVTYWR
jgi:hypothetical protein